MANNKEIKSVSDYLSIDPEKMPDWIENYEFGNRFDINEVFNNRILFYPGAGNDGEPIRICNKAHALHTYIYVDYGVSIANVLNEFRRPNVVRGYHLLDNIEHITRDILPSPFYTYTSDGHVKRTNFALLFVFERNQDYGEDFGAKRFAIIYIKEDAIKSYERLFANTSKAPYILVTKDHGFGGNYTRFDKDGLLNKFVVKNKPEYVLCANSSKIYCGYQKVEGVEADGVYSLYSKDK